MKQILLLRHAKSSHDSNANSDVDRPLTPRGIKDAASMGGFLRQIDIRPGTVVSSTATRARQTTRGFIEEAGMEEETVRWSDDLYYGSSQDYLQAIRTANDASDTVLLVGHNPKLEDIARRMAGNASVRMPTAGLVCLGQHAGEWADIQEGMASLQWMMIPKLLEKIGTA